MPYEASRDEKNTSVNGLTGLIARRFVILLLVVLVVYPLSSGPVLWLAMNNQDQGNYDHLIQNYMQPLVWIDKKLVAEDFSSEGLQDVHARMRDDYFSLFGDDIAMAYSIFSVRIEVDCYRQEHNGGFPSGGGCIY